MNLKDAILSTISEIEHVQDNDLEQPADNIPERPFNIKETKVLESTPPVIETLSPVVHEAQSESSKILENQFLHSIRERILVLFEGFQSPNNVSLESKVDLTLNFLEHLLSTIDAELDTKNKGLQ